MLPHLQLPAKSANILCILASHWRSARYSTWTAAAHHVSESARHAQVVRHWAALSLGDSHAAGVSTDAECYTWGCNDLGQLGYMGESKQLPTKMDILRGWDVKAIACGCASSYSLEISLTACLCCRALQDWPKATARPR